MKSSLTPQQLFNEVAKPNIQRSTFPRDHTWSGTFPGDKLIPCFWDEVYPGDTMILNLQAQIRYNTLIKPIQAVQYCDFHFFFVPMRLVWSNTKKFFGEQTDPGDSIDFLLPQVVAPETGFPLNSNFDSLNAIPLVDELAVRSDVFRAINLTWNRWYRDQNLQDSLPVPMGDGPDTWTDFTWDHANQDYYFPRNKRKDYLTSALPQPQKGDPVTISLGSTAPVIGNNGQINVFTDSNPTQVALTGSAGNNYLTTGTNFATSGTLRWSESPSTSGLVADLSDASVITINALREYNMLQVFLEKDMRGGTRFNELNYSHFGILSPDARVQDPEFLGGHSSDVTVTAIQQTSESGTTPQGTLAAMGNITTRGHAFNKSFTEQGVIFGLLSVRTDQMYQTGLNRLWSRRTRHDFYWPTYAHLGEQAILNKEVFAQGPNVVDNNLIVDDQPFGYAERYGELRYKDSTIFGLYRSSAPTSLDSWHLAQDFADLPTLSSDFIIENTPYSRVVAVPAEPDFNGQVYWDYKCTRPMPIRSIPSLMDRL